MERMGKPEKNQEHEWSKGQPSMAKHGGQTEWVCNRCGISMPTDQAVRIGGLKLARAGNKAQIERLRKQGYRRMGRLMQRDPIGGRLIPRKVI